MKVVVIGIDGATWDPVIPYLKMGMLPGYGKFWNEGLHGPLISTIPYITQPGWKAYSTGLNPGKMGVYWWSKIDWKNFKIRNINSTGFHGPDYWDLLSGIGKRVAIIDMPSTFPPKKVNGVMISGFPHGEGDWTYPPDFEKGIPADYLKEQVHLFTKNEDPEVTMDGIERDIRSRFDMAERLWDNDLVHVTITMNDHVSHFMWDRESIMLRNLKANDEGISKILSRNRDGFTILMSDHGNGPIEDEFYANEFLAREGLLAKKEGRRKVISREAVVNLGNKVGLYKVVRNLPEGVQERIVRKVKELDSNFEFDVEELIDWKESKVIALDEGLFYVNPMFSDRKEEIISDLVERLKQLKSKTGKQVYRNILRGREVYWGPYVSEAPDVVAITNEIYHQRFQLSGYMWATDIPERRMAYRTRQVAHHRIRGIFGLVGPGVTPREITPSIYDLAPTILKIMSCPIPEDMDGKPLL